MGYAEAVLLVDDDESEMKELYGVFDDGMGANQDLYRTVGNALKDGLAFLSFHNAGEQFHADIHVAQKLADGGQMLFGQYFRRRHDAGLIAVV